MTLWATCRYHMFLSAMAHTCEELGLSESAAEYISTLAIILLTTQHINTMMWIGGMRDCPLDLAGQGQLLKQGTVKERAIKGSGRKEKKCSSCQLFLFQHCLVLCRTKVNLAEPGSPHLAYSAHIRLTHISPT